MLQRSCDICAVDHKIVIVSFCVAEYRPEFMTNSKVVKSKLSHVTTPCKLSLQFHKIILTQVVLTTDNKLLLDYKI